MPPRPRPCSVGTPPSPVILTGTSTSDTRHKEEAEDALFIRNRGRSLREVNKRVARAIAVTQPPSSPTGSENGDEGEEDTIRQGFGRKAKQNIFHTGRAQVLPTWTKKGAIKNLLGDLNSELVNDESSYDETSSKKRHPWGSGTGTPSGRPGKRARTKSRSRSLTPPPDLTQAEKLRAQIAIQSVFPSRPVAITSPKVTDSGKLRHALSSQLDDIPPRSSVIDLEDDEDDKDFSETTLDPELQHIAQTIRDRALKQKTNNNQKACPEMSRHIDGSAEVVITVKWVRHPEDDIMSGPRQSWLFAVRRHDSFKELFLQTSDKAHVLPEDLVLMHSGRQVYTSVSPDGLGLWDQGVLEACDRTTFDTLRARHFRSPTPVQQDVNDYVPVHESFPAPPSEASLGRDDTDKFKLVLRSPTTKEITLSVRSTTTCGKIVRAFLAVVAKHGGEIPKSPHEVAKVRLCVDGEKQDLETPISDCGLEDGDLVEVVGM